MTNHPDPFGSVSIVPANHGGRNICAVKMIIDNEGFFGAIDLGPDEARAMALQLLTCVGVVNPGDIAREMVLGARH
jgi:hypothetical protein